MKVDIKFSVRELVGNIRDGTYELQEGTTVHGLIDASLEEAQKILSEDKRKSIVFLVNSRPASWETVLHDGDQIRAIYKILGG